VSGNLSGNKHHTRHLLNQEFIQALLVHFRRDGKKAIEKVARNQPAAYLKILALVLVPKEHKVKHSGTVSSLTDEQLDSDIAAIQDMLTARAGDEVKVIDSLTNAVALPAPEGVFDEKSRRQNKVLDAADTAVGPKERKSRKRVSPALPNA
jgi:hypothetical protein